MRARLREALDKASNLFQLCRRTLTPAAVAAAPRWLPRLAPRLRSAAKLRQQRRPRRPPRCRRSSCACRLRMRVGLPRLCSVPAPVAAGVAGPRPPSWPTARALTSRPPVDWSSHPWRRPSAFFGAPALGWARESPQHRSTLPASCRRLRSLRRLTPFACGGAARGAGLPARRPRSPSRKWRSLRGSGRHRHERAKFDRGKLPQYRQPKASPDVRAHCFRKRRVRCLSQNPKFDV